MWDNNQNILHKLLIIILWFLSFLLIFLWQLKDWVGQVLFFYTPVPRRGRGVYCPSKIFFVAFFLVGFYTHWTYMHIFCHLILSNYWWQKSDIWSQASYRYPILWKAFFDPSYSYFLFAEEQGYHKWALAHSSSCWIRNVQKFYSV